MSGKGSAMVGLDERGQSTVEYALVLVAFLSMSAAMACLWHAGREGVLLDLATSAASHLWQGGDVLGSLKDVSLF